MKRRFVRGGPAEVVPERSSARTVSVQEEESEHILVRYGADIEMSTNLLAGEPGLAAADLALKMDHQKMVLDQALTQLGYDAVLSGGLNLSRCLLEHSPQYSHLPEHQRAVALEEIAVNNFACAQKYENWFPNLLATIKKSTLVTSGVFDTVILPSGLPEIEKFSKKENYQFYLTGIDQKSNEKISFDLNNGIFTDQASGMTVAVTYPVPTMAGGSIRPRMQRSGVQRVRTIATFHRMVNADGNPIPRTQAGSVFVMNLHTGNMEKVSYTASAITAGDGEVVFVRPRVQVMTSAAIVGKQGCGELMMSYPMTSVSNMPTAPEQLRMQLRTYLGAAVTRSEDVIVAEDVIVDGVLSGGGTRIEPARGANFDPEQHDGFFALVSAGHMKHGLMYSSTSGPYDDQAFKTSVDDGMKERVMDSTNLDNESETYPQVIHQGSTWFRKNDGQMIQHCENHGHLGVLDNPKYVRRLSGMNLHAERPTQVQLVN